MGLLRPVHRDAGGTRWFSPEALVRLQLVVGLREAGLSVAEIRWLLQTPDRCAQDRRRALQELGRHLEEQLRITEQKMRRLRHLQQELKQAVELLERHCQRCDEHGAPECCRRCPHLQERGAARVLWGCEASEVPAADAG